MASSPATPQPSGTKSFLTDPKGVCDDVFESVCDIGSKFEVGSTHRKTLVGVAKKLNAARSMDWTDFCENADNSKIIESMKTAVENIATWAGRLETLLAADADATAVKKIETHVKFINSNVDTLDKQVRSKLKLRVTLGDMSIGEDAYTDKPDNEGAQTWRKARFKKEIKELVIDASSCGDRFDQGSHQRDNGPAN